MSITKVIIKSEFIGGYQWAVSMGIDADFRREKSPNNGLRFILKN